MCAFQKHRLTASMILRVLEENKPILQSLSVKRIGLFGSFSKNRANAKSDLDFLVSFENPTFDNYMETKFLLERLFERKIDLVTEPSLKPDLQFVKKEALYAKAV